MFLYSCSCVSVAPNTYTSLARAEPATHSYFVLGQLLAVLLADLTPLVLTFFMPVPSCTDAVRCTVALGHTQYSSVQRMPNAPVIGLHATPLRPSFAIYHRHFSLYVPFPGHNRSRWCSVRLASRAAEGADFEMDKERAALSLSCWTTSPEVREEMGLTEKSLTIVLIKRAGGIKETSS